MSRRGNNEGSIYRRKDGYWVGQYGVQTAEGTKTRYIYGKHREDVREKLTKAIADRDGGLIYDADNLTVGEYLDCWLNDSVRDTVRRRTWERYEQFVRVHLTPALGKIKLVLRSLKTVHKSAPPMPRRLWRSSPHPRLRFAIQLASSDPPRIVYLVAVGEIYPG